MDVFEWNLAKAQYSTPVNETHLHSDNKHVIGQLSSRDTNIFSFFLGFMKIWR